MVQFPLNCGRKDLKGNRGEAKEVPKRGKGYQRLVSKEPVNKKWANCPKSFGKGAPNVTRSIPSGTRGIGGGVKGEEARKHYTFQI